MCHRIPFGSTVALPLGAAIALVFFGASVHTSRADGATHATSLQSEDWDYEGKGAEPGVTARIASTSASDAKIKITIFWTLPSSDEAYGGECEAPPPSSGTYSLAWDLPRSEFPSKSQVRAVFTAEDRSGRTTFEEQRTYTVP